MVLPSEFDVPDPIIELAFDADLDAPASWVWTDLSHLAQAQTISIKRGRADESSQAQPATTGFRLDNLEGDLTPHNPMSKWYPHVARGLPVRVRVPSVPGILAATGPLLLTGIPGSYVSTPDDPSLHLTGDLSVRFEGDTADWGLDFIVAGRASALADISWFFTCFDGFLFFNWSPNGTEGSRQFRQSTETLHGLRGRRAWRADLDVNNGAAGHTVTFYSADTLAGPWTPFGDPVVTAGLTSVHAGTSPVEVGSVAGGDGAVYVASFTPFPGKLWGFELYDGPTRVAAPSFVGHGADDRQITDPEGLTWSLQGEARFLDPRVRFVGQADQIAPSWPYGDLSNGDHPGEAVVDISASGALHRLRQGDAPLESTMYRAITSPGNRELVVAHFPMEDASGATSAASSTPGVAPMFVGGEVSFAGDDSLAASKPLPNWPGGQPGAWSAFVPRRDTDQWRVNIFTTVPTPVTSPAETLLAQITSDGTIPRWTISVNNAALIVRGFDADDTEVFEDGAVPSEFFDGPVLLSLEVLQEGGNIRRRFTWFPPSAVPFGFEATIAGTMGPVTRVASLFTAPPDGITFGHMVVSTGTPLAWLGWEAGANNAYAEEPVAERIRRLGIEEGISIRIIGSAADSTRMGPQRPAGLTQLLQEAADADGGILADQRDWPGLLYVTRTSLYNQPVQLALDAAAGGIGDITPPFEPVEDDQRLINDVIVSRQDGSSARATTDPPPKPNEHYEDEATLNVAADAGLPGQASWRLRLGTWPGMRYPAVATELAATPGQVQAWVDAELGARTQVINLPPQHPTDVVDLLAQQLVETLSPTRWKMESTCVPAGPYEVGVRDDDERGRRDTAGSNLVTAVDEVATSLHVTTPVGPLWTTEAGDFPFDLELGGEQVTATASTSPVLYATDTFGRTITNTWGSTPAGLAWTETGGAASDRAVNGTTGRITLAATPGTVRLQAVGPTLTDVDVLASISPDQIATGAALLAAALMRFANASDYYRVRANFNTDSTVSVSVARGTIQIGVSVATGLNYLANGVFWLRAQVTAHSVRGRIWADGSPEPGTWTIERAITLDPVPAGQAGLAVSALGGNTNVNPVLSFDNLELQDMSGSQFTVVRGQNQVEKSHAAGTALRLWRPASRAL